MSFAKLSTQAAALALGTLMAHSAIACTECDEKVKAAAAAMAESNSTEAQGLVVIRDSATGQLRSATAQEAAALGKAAPAATNNSLVGAKASRNVRSLAAPASLQIQHASGARGMRLNDAMMSYSVVTRNADGSLTTTCVQGKEAADQAVTAAAPAPKATAELE